MNSREDNRLSRHITEFDSMMLDSTDTTLSSIGESANADNRVMIEVRINT